MRITVTTTELQPGDIVPRNAYFPGSTIRSVVLSEHKNHYWVVEELHQTLSPEPFLMKDLCHVTDSFEVERAD